MKKTAGNDAQRPRDDHRSEEELLREWFQILGERDCRVIKKSAPSSRLGMTRCEQPRLILISSLKTSYDYRWVRRARARRWRGPRFQLARSCDHTAPGRCRMRCRDSFVVIMTGVKNAHE